MKKYFDCFAFAFIITALFFSCHKNQEENSDDEAESIFSVKTEVVQQQEFDVYIKLNGNVTSNNSVSVYPEVSGKLVKTYVNLGSKVKKGDAIIATNSSVVGEEYRNNIVRSPIAGVITSVPLKIGSYVTTSTVVATVGDISRLRICCDVPERYAAFLHKGINAQVCLVAHPEEIFSASVESYSPVIDEISRTKQVFLDFDEIDSRVEAGMFAKIKLFIKKYSGVIVIPESAIIMEGEENFVFVKNADQTVTRRIVTVGERIDAKARIISGLNEGMPVVTEGNLMLSDGLKVNEILEEK